MSLAAVLLPLGALSPTTLSEQSGKEKLVVSVLRVLN